MKNITLRFGGVVAIKDISFDIREGEIRAIIGPNGAGKSSMLNVISGFYVPQEGEVWFRERASVVSRAGCCGGYLKNVCARLWHWDGFWQSRCVAASRVAT